MSARHRKPAPLHHHFALTALLAAVFLGLALLVLHMDDPSILAGFAVFGRAIHFSGRPQHWDGRSSVEVTWESWRPKVAVHIGRVRRNMFLFGRWLLADEHALTLFKIGAALLFVGVVFAATPGGVAIPVAITVLAGAVVGLVLAVVHRNDVVKPGSVLGRKGGAR